MLKELINKLLWHPEYNHEDYMVTYLHRGAENDKKSVLLKNISIEDSFLVFDETHIPFHRILQIENIKTGEIIYKKR